MDTTRTVLFIWGFSASLLFIGRACAHEEAPKAAAPDTVVVEAKSTQNNGAVQMMARALYSETKEMASFEYVAWTIRNRVRSSDYPSSVYEVVLQDSQFSAFNSPGRKNRLMAMSYPQVKITEFRRAYRVAQYVLAAPEEVNPLPGVTHFYMQDTLKRKYGISKPHWANGDPYYSHGQIRFYRDVHPPSYQTSTSR